uniref:Uncharacterized protein n=1 Tax=Arundo donax TaxID=35708 RepID=A0A0A9DV83_ARUDO
MLTEAEVGLDIFHLLFVFSYFPSLLIIVTRLYLIQSILLHSADEATTSAQPFSTVPNLARDLPTRNSNISNLGTSQISPLLISTSSIGHQIDGIQTIQFTSNSRLDHSKATSSLLVNTVRC